MGSHLRSNFPSALIAAVPLTLLGSSQAQAPQPSAEQPLPSHGTPAAPPPSPIPTATSPLPPQASKHDLGSFAVVARLGMLVGGSGELERSCEGSACGVDLDGVAGYQHATAPVLGADFLWQLAPYFRLGPGIRYTISVSLSPADASASEYDMGPMASLGAIGELSLRVSRTVWLLPHLELGVSLLSPEGDLDDTLDETHAECESLERIDGCDALDGMRLGAHVGLGFGGLFAVSDALRLRVDSLLEGYRMRLYHLEATDNHQTMTLNSSGIRVLLLGGMEF